MNFYPRPPRGGRHQYSVKKCVQKHFYPRPPRGGRQHLENYSIETVKISIHALREEGDCAGYVVIGDTLVFLSTPSARRATHPHKHGLLPAGISIHALREEGDRNRSCVSGTKNHFYPRPPRGGRHSQPGHPAQPGHFYPRPPRGGRPACCDDVVADHNISIHALREEGDIWQSSEDRLILYFYPRPPRGGRRVAVPGTFDSAPISIHALREEGDLYSASCSFSRLVFLSTPSARRATVEINEEVAEEWHFYPRPPRGGRRQGLWFSNFSLEISIHALREEGDVR